MFRNLTPHAVNIVREDNTVLTIEPEETPARVSMTVAKVSELDGVGIYASQYGEVTDLPEPEEGVWLIVSRMVLAASPERHDLLVPGTLIRDDAGNVTGCKGLSQS